ncbi:precorrin-2 C(20)-methyltransferase [Oculatella sp. LEGE 06141]|uniref:precorrin-2 C(20)-methyltransferase n=1 Tax=Oculatella sp. LEGE 06141 TaxID=1828648 RepID=UPI00187F0531|nr:precorrin-2 C(20)-methyltransferase [Oculatella sp. LEGE 06141]MBE9181303.1 precorrin-2 C(20)-methyltransferase [Oculatella sp. LEGE 06141]
MHIHALGTLRGIGLGPGDPELMTIKGLRLLQEAPVVAFPAGLQGKPGMAQRAIDPWLRPHQIELPLVFPYVLDDAQLKQAWEVAAIQVWQFLHRGQDVVFVSEGDIGFYSTFTYLAQTLQHLHPEAEVEAIPGVSSPMAAAAMLGMPLTVRSQRLMVLPALYTVADLETAIATVDVIVLMKVSSVYQQVWTVLKQHGLLPHSYVVERATLPNQVIYADLSDRPSLILPYFSILIVQVNPGK